MAKFTKGQSGNPRGRPKTESAALRKALADRGGEVADVVLAAALGGTLRLVAWCWKGLCHH